MVSPIDYTRDRNRLLLVYFLFYYAVLIGWFADDRLLFQYRPVFFNYNRDLSELTLIALGIPRWMIAHPGSFAAADSLAFILPLPLIWRELRGKRFSPWPGIVFIAGMAGYLLLADIFWQVHHEPFLVFFLLAFVWTTGRADRFYLILKGCRLYFLYIFISAAVWKLARGAVFNSHEMSRILLLHHTDLLTADCRSITCRTYVWLIARPAASQALYLAGTLVEAVFLIGLFTRRWDRWLIGLAVLFVIADLLVMRIPYWTILIGAYPLWLRTGVQSQSILSPSTLSPSTLSPSAPPPSNEKRIVLYETTHHENLPALLDLSEAEFNQVIVFLKELSFHNLAGEGSPEQRWPQTEFIIQTAGCPNRRFVRQLFSYIRRHGVTHLHCCTLDNNLLIFTLRLAIAGRIHVSLTVHEVNLFFVRSWRSLRDGTETLAKLILRYKIRHYHVFLPAMADQLRKRLPRSTVVVLPSRFYSGHRPPLTAGAPASPFRIVIPGSIDPGRRNYAEVLRCLRTVSSSPSVPFIELILLGDGATVVAAPIIAEFRSIDSARISIRTFSGYIPETTYEQELTRSHLIWSPLHLDKHGSRNSRETYGRSTASGLTADILLNNIPALVPAGFIIPEPFRAAISPYRSTEEAWSLILGFIDEPAGYAMTRATIHQAFSYFSRENFTGAFIQLTGP
ncbi:MAG TPA: hypothetical protein VMH27_12650 [Puia sp.]|nr:hypothetical protein [Puia sp.]